MLKKSIKIFCGVLAALDVLTFGVIGYYSTAIASNYRLARGDDLSLATAVPVTAEYNGALFSRSAADSSVGDIFDVDLKLLGAIPLSTVQIEIVDETFVSVLGQPFGIKLYTDGVLVIETTTVQTASGIRNPAAAADIAVGDSILSANGIKLSCNEDLSEIVRASNGEAVSLVLMRDGKKQKVTVKPVLAADTGEYRIGIWVRDSTAGIGTLTFYSPAAGILCGLGHGIYDEDTETLMTVESGQMVSARIIAVEKGAVGSPGELKGSFASEQLATIIGNMENGVYGIATADYSDFPLTEIALKQEVTSGAAQILCCIDGTAAELYDCTVQRPRGRQNQDLIIKITDADLLEKTGGIVQGMSGSPILQNGKLIGAITHVLVDNPTTGYGIFAENMLHTAQSVANEN